MITHRELISRNRAGEVVCSGACIPIYSGACYTLYRCKACQAQIAAYGGKADERNYTPPPKEKARSVAAESACKAPV